jgi:hypothetical protein
VDTGERASGGSLTSVALSSATFTLTLVEGAGAADTTVGAMTVAMAANAAGARDAIGNSERSGDRRSTRPDRRRRRSPTPTAAWTARRTGDTIVVTFSEPLATASVPNSQR